MSKNMWGADPEKYERLSIPFESPEQMEAAASSFLAALAKLREQYKIPDLIVSFQGDVQVGDDVRAFYGGAGWGNQIRQAKLAKRSADQEFNHLLRIMREILHEYPDTEELLITDPEDTEDL